MKKKHIGKKRDKHKLKEGDVIEITRRQHWYMGFPQARFLIIDVKKKDGKDFFTARLLDKEWDYAKNKKCWRDNENDDNNIEFLREGEMEQLLLVYPEAKKGETKVHKSKGEQ
jgi:hypothetical protein